MKFPIDIKEHLREFEILFPDNLWGEYMLRMMLQMANAAYKQGLKDGRSVKKWLESLKNKRR